MSMLANFITLLVILISSFGLSQEVVITSDFERESLGKNVSFYLDKSGELTLDEAIELMQSDVDDAIASANAD